MLKDLSILEEENPKKYNPPETGIHEFDAELRTGQVEDDIPEGPDKKQLENIRALHRRNRSRQLMMAFRPTKLFLDVMGRFPYDMALKVDGAVNIRIMRNTFFSSPMYLLTSFLSIVLFIIVSVGLMAGYLNSQRSQEWNICNKTWEEESLKRTMVPLALTWTWLGLLTVSSTYGMVYWKELGFYYNYWNRAVQIMDMNVTYGVLVQTTVGNVEFAVLVIILFILYLTEMSGLLQDTSAMLVNTALRFDEDYKDLYKWGRKPYLERDYFQFVNNINSSTVATPEVFTEPLEYKTIKLCGFLVMLFALYGAKCFIGTFSFFCQVLRNAAWIWNERFRNHLNKVKPNLLDQTKRRLDDKILIKDHLILVQLFKMTEESFCVVLQAFYFVQIVNLIMLMYGISLLATTTSCHQFWNEVDSFGCSETVGRHDQWNAKVSNDSEASSIIWVSFENPLISKNYYKVQDFFVNIVLFTQCVYVLALTTTTAASAYEEAMRGWQILRRHSFMSAKTSNERNFMHSLIISFARNNPLQISAGGYFVVNKRLLVTILLTVLVYFTIMIQFAPGEIDMKPMCNGRILDRTAQIV